MLFFRLDTAAQKLDISRAMAYLLAKRGELPTVRIGRSIRVPAAALEQYARQKMEEAGVGVA